MEGKNEEQGQIVKGLQGDQNWGQSASGWVEVWVVEVLLKIVEIDGFSQDAVPAVKKNDGEVW